jgi:hypothetical protein
MLDNVIRLLFNFSYLEINITFNLCELEAYKKQTCHIFAIFNANKFFFSSSRILFIFGLVLEILTPKSGATFSLFPYFGFTLVQFEDTVSHKNLLVKGFSWRTACRDEAFTYEAKTRLILLISSV